MENSTFGKINWRELLNGLIMSIYGGVLGFLYEALLNKGEITWNNVAYAAIIAGVGYLSKKITTTSDGRVLGLGKKR
jgi:hypothetical protein